MATHLDRPPIELLAGPTPAGAQMSAQQSPRLSRGTRFLLVFVLAAIASLLFTFLRTPVYRSTAMLLVEPPTPSSALAAKSGGAPALSPIASSSQFLATERQRLLSEPVLTPVATDFASALADSAEDHGPFAALQGMVDVTYVVRTNLMELSVEGSEAVLLAKILTRWLTEYEAARSASANSTNDHSNSELQTQLAALETRIAEQRRRMDRFRSAHGIVSTELADNRELAKLTGLNDSINRAEEDEAKAQARLAAVREALAAGEPVTQDSDREALEQLEEKVRGLRDKVDAYAGRFTEKFAEIAPEITTARNNLEKAEVDLANKRKEATEEVLASALYDVKAAQTNKAALVGQQAALKTKLTDFGRQFEEFKALQQRLADLEAQAAALRERQVKTEVAPSELFAKVSTLSAPTTPTRPIRPNYTRDAGIALGSALALALLMTLLTDFLTQPPRDTGIPERTPTIYSYNTHLMPPGLPMMAPDIAPTLPRLDAPMTMSRRELMPAEVSALLNVADDQAKLIIALLCTGASAAEIAAATATDLDAEGELKLRGRSSALTLPADYHDLLARYAASLTTPDAPLFEQSSGGALTVEDLNATLTYLAHDAGISRPAEISAANLQHTYLAYLVRQGVRLGELSRVAGALPPAVLVAYASYAPPGAGRRLEDIDAVYPALASLS